MVNVHIHEFDAKADVIDAEALAVFQAQWAAYQKLVDTDVLSHSTVSRLLHAELSGRFDRPFSFLDIACGDASLPRAALAGTQAQHYHGVDLSAPAIDLAARKLAAEPYEVDLDHRDFVEAMADRESHADAVWCGLSLHHLHTGDKLRLFRAARDVVGDGGVFLFYEPTLEDGEDRDTYLERTWQIIPERWSFLTPAELDQIWQHVKTYDLPETSDNWCALGREAGFAQADELFKDPTALYRMFRYVA